MGEGRRVEEAVAAVGRRGQITLGADRGYDTSGFVTKSQYLKATPQVPQKHRSTIHVSTTRHEGYGKARKFARGLRRSPAG